MNQLQRLRGILNAEIRDIRRDMAEYPREETHYQDGKLFALMSTVEKIDALLHSGPVLGPEDEGRPDDYLLYKGHGLFSVLDDLEDGEVVLVVNNLSVVVRPGPTTVLVDIKSYPVQGPCDEILHGRLFTRYDPRHVGVLDKR